MTTLAGLGLTVSLAQAGLATTFYLQQRDDFGGIALSGQFTGEDTDNNLSLTLSELTSFNLSTYGLPVYTLPDFTFFSYALDGSNSIAFSAEKTEVINDGTISTIDYYLSVDSESDPITFGGSTTFFVDPNTPPIIGDIFANQPVRVSTSIPEGSNIIALSLLGILALYQKKAKSNFNHQK
ncbi:hypothetical protein [Chroococcus sp. FPU101]|uniref:hypothetical protein n=1 Tax=Chroococcus sp. FPU101 TaxID=1974212 RepID=UPI001A8F7D99|nr:hypothetical protein [Chroococcus sp. FPU101]